MVHQFTDYDRQINNEYDSELHALEDKLVRDQLGWFYIGLAIAVILVTVYIIFVTFFKSIALKIKAIWSKITQTRALKE